MNDIKIGTLAFGLLALTACRDDPPAGAGGTDGDTDATGNESEGETDTDTDTDTDTEGEIDPNPASPIVRELLESACDLSLRCCSRGEVDYYLGPWVDEDSCADRLFDLATVSGAAVIDLASLAGITDVSLVIPNLAALDQAVQEGRVVVDEEAVDACRDHLQSVACNEAEGSSEGCEPLPPPPADSPCDLEDLFVGQLLEEEVCSSIDGASLDCAPGLTCAVGLGLGTTGRCVAVKHENEPCTATAECDRDLYCAPLDATCQRLRTEGEVCVFADREDPSPPPETLLLGCTPDLSCDPITSICVARCQAGAACIYDEECDDGQELTCIVDRCGMPRAAGLPCAVDDDCDEGLHCGPDVFDPAALVCTAPKQNNDDCVAHDECQSGFCRPSTLRCSPQVMVGDACISGDSSECDGGACVREEPLTSCEGPADCPITGVCNTTLGQCGTYCVEAKPDGATCLVDTECTSNACVAGFCRTRPLDPGVACEVAEDCGSSFCSYDTMRVCAELPLPLGSPCLTSFECESGVCFSTVGSPECINGSEEGEPCGESDRPPCNPKQYYCDQEAEPTPLCAPLKETGEECETETECRGDCALRHSRLLCTPAAAEDEAVCDGSA
jgi:hypothetical protein